MTMGRFRPLGLQIKMRETGDERGRGQRATERQTRRSGKKKAKRVEGWKAILSS
jgi:hypothetical protein